MVVTLRVLATLQRNIVINGVLCPRCPVSAYLVTEIEEYDQQLGTRAGQQKYKRRTTLFHQVQKIFYTNVEENNSLTEDVRDGY